MKRRAAVWMGVVILALSMHASTRAHAQLSHIPPGGEIPITLDLKGLDILDVLKVMSEKANLSFVAGRNVTGRVTLFVKDVPLWSVFEMVMAANGLAYEQQGSIINVMTGRDYELIYGDKFQDPKHVEGVRLRYAKAPQVATVLNQIKSNVGRIIVDESSNSVIIADLPAKVEQMRALIEQLDMQTQTFIWELQYAHVEDLQDKLQTLLTPTVGTMHFDERTNKLVVKDWPDVIQEIDARVRAFDAKTRQVMIDTKIVQVTLSDVMNLGIDWSAVMERLNVSTTRGNFDLLGDVLGGSATGWVLSFREGGGTLTAVIEALETYGHTNIVSSPSIMVTERQEAKLLIGTKEAFVTTTVVTPGGGSPTTTAEDVTFVDVGVNLTVTPIITADGFVNLQIRPEVSSVERELTTAQGNTIPIVKTSEAETNVLLKNGTTLMIGGLIEDRQELAENKIPLLGDVPLIKYFFRSTKNTKKKTETIIFLTPHIVAGDENVHDTIEAKQKSPVAVDQLSTTPIRYEAFPADELPLGYREEVRRRLLRTLHETYRGLQAPPMTGLVTFAIYRDGTILIAPTVEGIEQPVVVRRTIEAVHAAAPFPPFPEGSDLVTARFRIPVEFSGQ